LLNNLPSSDKCGGEWFAVGMQTNTTTCLPLSGSSATTSIASEVIFYNTTKGYTVEGVTLSYTGGDPLIPKIGSFNIRLICDKNEYLKWNEQFIYE